MLPIPRLSRFPTCWGVFEIFSSSMKAQLPNEVEVTVYFSPHRSGRWKAVSFSTLSAASAWKTKLGKWWPTLAKQMYPANSGSCCKQHDGSTEISLFLCAWDFGNKEEWFCLSDSKCFHCAHQQATISAEHLVFLSFQRRSCGWEGNEESCWNQPSVVITAECPFCSWCPYTAAPREGRAPSL